MACRSKWWCCDADYCIKLYTRSIACSSVQWHYTICFSVVVQAIVWSSSLSGSEFICAPNFGVTVRLNRAVESNYMH